MTPSAHQSCMLNIFNLSPLQDTPARKTALLAMQALRADSPLADRLETKHLEIIFSQLYGEDAFTELRQVDPNASSTGMQRSRKQRQRALRYSLALLSQLQTMRRPRTQEMYRTILRHCVHVGKPDMAAAVFAGLVEEWILEGRVAEVGVDTTLFGEGGVPAVPQQSAGTGGSETDATAADLQVAAVEQAARTRRMKQIIDGWFEGVRTWRLPGEGMAPLDKLKLWHPKTLKLQEKMKNFPFPSPTSPPSLVPPPNAEMLDIIISSLTYHPAVSWGSARGGRSQDPVLASQNRPYRRSARALAILGNTILSRTLPVTALKSLFQAMRKMSIEVPVYPTTIKWQRIPIANRSEFSAGTHIHAALMSLLWSPPSLNFPHGRWASYRLPPLTLTSTRVLLHYAVKALPSGATIVNFFRHIKSAFGIGMLSKEKLGPPVNEQAGHWKGFFRVNKIDEQLQVMERNAGSVEIPEPPLKDEDVIFKLRLIQDGNKAEIESIVYKAFPFLDVHNYRTLPIDADYAILHREQHRRTRLAGMAKRRSPWIFVACLNALQRTKSTPLAERLYLLALRAEQDSARPFRGVRKESDHTDTWFLPIEGHTAMLQLYSLEQRDGLSSNSARQSSSPFRGLDYNKAGGMTSTKSHITPQLAAWQSAGSIVRYVLDAAAQLKLDQDQVQATKQKSSDFEWSIRSPPLPDSELLSLAIRMSANQLTAWTQGKTSPEEINRIGRMTTRIYNASNDYQVKLPRSTWNDLTNIRREARQASTSLSPS